MHTDQQSYLPAFKKMVATRLQPFFQDIHYSLVAEASMRDGLVVSLIYTSPVALLKLYQDVPEGEVNVMLALPAAAKSQEPEWVFLRRLMRSAHIIPANSSFFEVPASPMGFAEQFAELATELEAQHAALIAALRDLREEPRP